MDPYKVGTRVKIIKIDETLMASGCIWRVGDTGIVTAHNVRPFGETLELQVKMDKSREGRSYSYGDRRYYVPITKLPLLERIRRWFIRPSIDLTPGFKWEDLGWHPKDFIPEEETEKEQ